MNSCANTSSFKDLKKQNSHLMQDLKMLIESFLAKNINKTYNYNVKFPGIDYERKVVLNQYLLNII